MEYRVRRRWILHPFPPWVETDHRPLAAKMCESSSTTPWQKQTEILFFSATWCPGRDNTKTLQSFIHENILDNLCRLIKFIHILRILVLPETVWVVSLRRHISAPETNDLILSLPMGEELNIGRMRDGRERGLKSKNIAIPLRRSHKHHWENVQLFFENHACKLPFHRRNN